MLKLKTYPLEEIFTPGGQPSITYNNREHLGIEASVKKAIALPTTIVALTGPTKCGKTVLCKSVLEKNEYVWIDGGQIKSEADVWQVVCTELRLAAEFSTQVASSDQIGGAGSVEASLGVPGSGIKFGYTANGSRLSSTTEVEKHLPSNSHQAIEALLQRKVSLVIDDFHYIEEDHRASIVKSIKGAVFRGLKVVLLSTPHRAFEAIRAESEITGRFKHVTVPPWTVEDLSLIATSGFDALNVKETKVLVADLAKECEGSPLLMQRFCWSICYDAEIHSTSTFSKKLANVDLDKLFNEVAEDAGLPIYERLAKGPQSRTDRIRRPLAKGGDVDIYEAILLAVAMTGPKDKLTYEEIRSSLNTILLEKIPQKLEVSNTLNHLTAIDQRENKGQRAIDWDNQNLNLFLTDPFFRFYLRWKIAYAK